MDANSRLFAEVFAIVRRILDVPSCLAPAHTLACAVLHVARNTHDLKPTPGSLALGILMARASALSLVPPIIATLAIAANRAD